VVHAGSPPLRFSAPPYDESVHSAVGIDKFYAIYSGACDTVELLDVLCAVVEKAGER
jgi:hypothetical protein